MAKIYGFASFTATGLTGMTLPVLSDFTHRAVIGTVKEKLGNPGNTVADTYMTSLPDITTVVHFASATKITDEKALIGTSVTLTPKADDGTTSLEVTEVIDSIEYTGKVDDWHDYAITTKDS